MIKVHSSWGVILAGIDGLDAGVSDIEEEDGGTLLPGRVLPNPRLGNRRAFPLSRSLPLPLP